MRREKDLELNKDKKYNTTQLHIKDTLERHIFHRDVFAHYLRWTHVLKIAEPGMTIVDFGCGTAELLELLYRNRLSPKKYVGLDIRQKTIEACREEWKKLTFAGFICQDLTEDDTYNFKADLVCSFEVMEHVGKKNADQFLQNFKRCGGPKATYLLSTPNFDPEVGAAQNHIYSGEVQEHTHQELHALLEKHFQVTAEYGTFASVRDYKTLMSESQRDVYGQLYPYYDANIMSVLFAPMFPHVARNTLWVLKNKKGRA